MFCRTFSSSFLSSPLHSSPSSDPSCHGFIALPVLQVPKMPVGLLCFTSSSSNGCCWMVLVVLFLFGKIFSTHNPPPPKKSACDLHLEKSFCHLFPHTTYAKKKCATCVLFRIRPMLSQNQMHRVTQASDKVCQGSTRHVVHALCAFFLRHCTTDPYFVVLGALLFFWYHLFARLSFGGDAIVSFSISFFTLFSFSFYPIFTHCHPCLSFVGGDWILMMENDMISKRMHMLSTQHMPT